MGTKVTWAKYGKWSGPQVKGICKYEPPENPSGFDVIVAATARPEGGAADTVVAYDGTAVTYGLLQWTFTSGRLHKLLASTMDAMVATAHSASYWYPFGDGLQKLTGLRVNRVDRNLYLGGKKVTDFFSLRDICTPPGGQCPKTGPNWKKAKAIALLFSKLGEDSIAQEVQLEFFREELEREISLKRPKMEGRTIASYLYPMGWEEGDPVWFPYMAALRALFFGAWQNSPRKAEEYLHRVFKGYRSPLNSQEAVDKLAKKIAYATYARWGVTKAANSMGDNGRPRPYTSRYEKMASVINQVLGRAVVPELWR